MPWINLAHAIGHGFFPAQLPLAQVTPDLPWVGLVLTVILSYLIGSIPFGFLIARSRGIDIRQHGSGNIGATNVLRVVGKKEGIFAFILDFLKGLLAVFVGFYFGNPALQPVFFGLAAAFAVILGHNYTFWLGFKGGKGIATSAGALVALMPVVVLVAVGIFALVLAISRIVSLASISAAASLPITMGVLLAMGVSRDWALLVMAVLVAALAIWRHRSNIGRLLRGEEARIGAKKAAPQAADATGTVPPSDPPVNS